MIANFNTYHVTDVTSLLTKRGNGQNILKLADKEEMDDEFNTDTEDEQ